MIEYNDMFAFSDCPRDRKLYKMNIIGKDAHDKNIINYCRPPRKFKEDNKSNACKKRLYAGLSHMMKNLSLLSIIQVKLIDNIKNW